MHLPRFLTRRPTLCEYLFVQAVGLLNLVVLVLQPDGPIPHRWPLLAATLAILAGMALARKFLHD